MSAEIACLASSLCQEQDQDQLSAYEYRLPDTPNQSDLSDFSGTCTRSLATEQIKLLFPGLAEAGSSQQAAATGTLRTIVRDADDFYTGEGSISYLEYPNAVSRFSSGCWGAAFCDSEQISPAAVVAIKLYMHD